MAESKAQKIARLQREIDSIEQNAYERAEAKRAQLMKIVNRPAPPSESNMMHVRVKFRNTATIYTFLIIQTPAGYFTTGTNANSRFSTWDGLLDWLDSADVQWHSGIEMLALTGEMACPKRESASEDEAQFLREIGRDYS